MLKNNHCPWTSWKVIVILVFTHFVEITDQNCHERESLIKIDPNWPTKCEKKKNTKVNKFEPVDVPDRSCQKREFKFKYCLDGGFQGRGGERPDTWFYISRIEIFIEFFTSLKIGKYIRFRAKNIEYMLKVHKFGKYAPGLKNIKNSRTSRIEEDQCDYVSDFETGTNARSNTCLYWNTFRVILIIFRGGGEGKNLTSDFIFS